MDTLKFINEQMDILEIPYEFGEWTSPKVQYPYFVGETPQPEEYPSEDGLEESELILTGFHRGKVIELETIKQKIKNHFHPVHGLRAEVDNGTIVVFYEGGFLIPTGEKDLKKIQINLKIKYWKGE